MKEIVRIKSISLHKLNNAEYANHANRMLNLAADTGAEAMGVTDEDLDRYSILLSQLNDLVARSYASAETAELAELDKQRDVLGKYIIDTVNAGQTLPLASKAAAAKALWLVLKPYKGFHDLPNQQETVTVSGMVFDLSKEENAAHLSALGLTEYVNELNLANTRYQTLTEQRTQSRESAKTDNSKTLRTEMDALYDYLTTVAFCVSVVTPTEDIARFVAQLNAIIDETNTAYNQRIAQVKAAEERRRVKAASEGE